MTNTQFFTYLFALFAIWHLPGLLSLMMTMLAALVIIPAIVPPKWRMTSYSRAIV